MIPRFSPLRAKLKEQLQKLSYKEREIVLASGQKSSYYFDCKQTSLHAEGPALIGELFYAALQELNLLSQIVGIGGMTLGADPLVTAVSFTASQYQTPLHAFIIRKEPKKHGTSQWIEGAENFKPGDRVVILEDVVSTGGSSLKACDRAEEFGLQIDAVLTIIDRELGGKEAILQRGYQFFSLFTKSDFSISP